MAMFGPQPSFYNVEPYRFTVGRNSAYKFVKLSRMQQFFKTGVLRVGTLHDFRNIEQHGNSIGDAVEGKSTVSQFVEYADSAPANTLRGQLIDTGGKAITITNSVFIQHRDTANKYMFCASNVFTEEGFSRWNEEEGLDACYEIFDIVGFQEAISRAIFAKARFLMSGDIIYIDGDIHGESELRHVPSMFIKQLPYAWQTEHRWVWRPRKSITISAHEFVTIPNPARYCRPLALLENNEIRYLNALKKKIS
jgi:hypothetical protein